MLGSRQVCAFGLVVCILEKKIVKKSQMPKWTIQYQTVTVYVHLPENPRKGRCDACKRTIKAGQIKTTQLHHWYYKYKPNTVKKNPILALENVSELCFRCHQIADALRTLTFLKDENLWQVTKVAMCMPAWMQQKFAIVARQYLASKKTKPQGNLTDFLHRKP